MAERRLTRSRSRNDLLNVVDVCEALAPFAVLKTPPFDWEVAGYGKTRRSQGPDRDGLEAYEQLLRVILRAAPSGHPSLGRLRSVWMWLHGKYGLMAPDIQSKGVPLCDWAAQAADTVRLMCKHLLDIKASRTTFLSPTLAGLVSMLKDAEPEGEEEVEERLPAPRTLKPQLSTGSSVVLCGWRCECPDCKQPAEVIDMDSDGASSTSLAAAAVETVPASSSKLTKALKEASKPVAAKAPKMKKPAAAAAAVAEEPSKAGAPKVKIVTRKKPEQAYVMVNGKFLIACSKARSPDFMAHIAEIKARAVANPCMTRAGAQAVLVELISACREVGEVGGSPTKP